MIGFNPPLNKENIYKRITSYDIFKMYCPEFKEIGKKFHGKFRTGDSYPSAQIDYYNGDLLYKDFGERGSSRAIDFVARLYNTDYFGALSIINTDFNLGLGDVNGKKSLKPVNRQAQKFFEKCEKISEVSKTKLLIKRREYTNRDLQYWGQYYWTSEMLKSTDIFPVSHFWINKSTKSEITMFKADSLAYSFDYYFHKGIFRRKVYQPFNKKIKFLSNVDSTIVQGYKRLKRHGDILIITSSLKDCGPFWRLGYDAIATNTEHSFLPIKFFEKQKSRFKRIIMWFDNDWDKEENQGVINAKKFSQEYNIEYFHNPDNTPKDPSDFCKEHSLNEFYQMFKSKVFY